MTTAKNARDLLYGVPAIADHLEMTHAQVYNMRHKGTLPTFKIGGKVCASKSYLAEHFHRLSQEAADGTGR